MTDAPDDLLRHAAFLRRLARALVADAADLDDALQDTWLTALQRGGQARTPRAWLASVVRNAALRARRGGLRRRRREALAAVPEAFDAEHAALQRELARQVIDAVFDLDEPYRSTIRMHYLEDLPLREIARRQGVPHETVRTRHRRAVLRIREALDRGHRGRREAWCASLARLVGRPTYVAPTLISGRVAAALLLFGLAVVGTIWLSRGEEQDVAPRNLKAVSTAPVALPVPAPAAASREIRAPVLAGEEVPRIVGRVVDNLGRSIANARVLLLRDDLSEAVDVNGPRVDSDGWRETTSDAAGAFALDGPGGATLLMWAEAKGYGVRAVLVRSMDEPVVLRLNPALRWTGTVRDLHGMPVAGARVTWSLAQCVARISRTTTTTGDGSFQLEGLTPIHSADVDVRSSVTVEAPGYARLDLHDPPALQRASGEAIQLDLYVTRGARIEGRVTDLETGRPIAGAEVRVRCSGPSAIRNGHGRSFLPFVDTSTIHARTEADGRFALDGVPAWGVHEVGAHWPGPGARSLGRLEVSAAGYAASNVHLFVPDEGAEEWHDVSLAPAATVLGRVVDEQGRGIAGAQVTGRVMAEALSRADEFEVRRADSTSTATDGSFALRGLPAMRRAPVQVVVSASAPNRYPEREPVCVEIHGGQTQVVPDVRLLPLPLLARIEVVDGAGRPVPRATVTVSPEDLDGSTDRDLRAHASTGLDGVADVYAMLCPPGTTLHFQATAGIDAAPAMGMGEVAVPGEGPAHARLVLPEAHPPAPQPAASTGAIVEAAVSVAETHQPLLRLRGITLRSDGESRRGTPAGPGVFTFRDVPSGTWHLVVSAQGHASPEPLPITVPGPGERVQVAVHVSRGIQVSGSVRATDDTDLSGRTIDFTPSTTGRSQTARLGPGGTFSVAGFSPGEVYRVLVRRGAFEETHATAPGDELVVPSADATDLRLQVHRGGYLFVTAQAKLLAAGQVTVLDPAGREIARETLDPASTGLPITLPFGAYRVRLEVAGAPILEEHVTLDRAGRTDIAFQFDG